MMTVPERSGSIFVPTIRTMFDVVLTTVLPGRGEICTVPLILL